MLTDIILPGHVPAEIRCPGCPRPVPAAPGGVYTQEDLRQWKASLPPCDGELRNRPTTRGVSMDHYETCKYRFLPPVVFALCDPEKVEEMLRLLNESANPCPQPPASPAESSD